ncbi:pirin-like bicupin family protein [Tateyamaria sp. syn59]|uniref:pirin family protein n=1 Tax=Tateyamaria sp. syn59 TaxID=2576942 RepID=UPI0011BE69ED|nr:pirin-like bicupin family protein [Tateyamaria sp. syn59]
MIKIHDKATRGRTRTGWLNSYHTFSFGAFNDPSRMGFNALRVINDDTLIPAGGFAAHDHSDMDILTLVLDGALRHEDDQGNIAVIRAGEVQAMSAGSGVRHSEFNASETDTTRFLQIWLIPNETGGTPTYAQAKVPETGNVLLAGEGGLMPVRSGARLWLRRFEEGAIQHVSVSDNDHFVHLIDGLADAEGERVSAGDGLQVPAPEAVSLAWQTAGAALVFEMPPARLAAPSLAANQAELHP